MTGQTVNVSTQLMSAHFLAPERNSFRQTEQKLCFGEADCFEKKVLNRSSNLSIDEKGMRQTRLNSIMAMKAPHLVIVAFT